MLYLVLYLTELVQKKPIKEKFIKQDFFNPSQSALGYDTPGTINLKFQIILIDTISASPFFFFLYTIII